MFLENGVGVYQRILVAEEPPHFPFVFYFGEALFLNRPVFLHHRLRDDKLLNAVFARVQESLLAYHAVGPHRVGYLEGRIHQYAVGAIKLLGIHAAHRSADDEVGLLFFLFPVE